MLPVFEQKPPKLLPLIYPKRIAEVRSQTDTTILKADSTCAQTRSTKQAGTEDGYVQQRLSYTSVQPLKLQNQASLKPRTENHEREG